MQDDAEIGAKVDKHGAKSLETQATSDNVHYVYPGMKFTVPSVDDTVLDSEGRQLYWAGTRIPMSAHSLAAVQYYRNRDAAHARTTPDPSHLSSAPSNAPQASLTPTSGIQDDDC